MFQHNTEGGRTNLLATLGKRSRLLQTRLAGTQWKVLVFGLPFRGRIISRVEQMHVTMCLTLNSTFFLRS